MAEVYKKKRTPEEQAQWDKMQKESMIKKEQKQVQDNLNSGMSLNDSRRNTTGSGYQQMAEQQAIKAQRDAAVQEGVQKLQELNKKPETPETVQPVMVENKKPGALGVAKNLIFGNAIETNPLTGEATGNKAVNNVMPPLQVAGAAAGASLFAGQGANAATKINAGAQTTAKIAAKSSSLASVLKTGFAWFFGTEAIKAAALSDKDLSSMEQSVSDTGSIISEIAQNTKDGVPGYSPNQSLIMLQEQEEEINRMEEFLQADHVSFKNFFDKEYKNRMSKKIMILRAQLDGARSEVTNAAIQPMTEEQQFIKDVQDSYNAGGGKIQ